MFKDTTTINRFKVNEKQSCLERDLIAIEEPMLINIMHREVNHAFTLTMRTPGQDEALIFGLLYSEGVIFNKDDVINVEGITHKQQMTRSNHGPDNQWEVRLVDSLNLNFSQFNRGITSYSGCGLCGKTSLQALELKRSRTLKSINSRLDVSLIRQLKSLLARQPLFSQTGGVHAAGLIYETEGMLELEQSPFFEDVGRHNALDKLIGHELLTNDLQQAGILVLSGRIGFELVQKAIMAGYSLIVALGAPSQLAIQAASQFGVGLIGFAKDHCFNLYTADQDFLK